ncbi:MAG: hypothetical protein N2690_03435 [Rhodocyclaceae bacterium]|nr:hypothetical protein [Rhodocyclaceae bacterium]
MPDERTPALQLPLPHADHLLDEDVERLRAALFALDAAIAGRDVALVQQLQAQGRRLRRLWLAQVLGLDV